MGLGEALGTDPDYVIPESGGCFLNLFYRQTIDLPFTKSGRRLGHDQIALREGVFIWAAQTAESAPQIEENERAVIVTGQNF